MLMACFCTGAPRADSERLKPVSLSPRQLTAVEDGVKSILKDPDSARISGIVAGVGSDGTITACGWVNAKNSYGGYTGKRPFQGLFYGKNNDSGFVMISTEEIDSALQARLELCHEAGLSLK
jgi:hypothetical protein